MREKNIKRAAKALYLSQADDKNDLLSRRISDPKARKLVQDQGRALIILEKIVLPYKKEDYSCEEMEILLTKKLKKKGHKIQADDAEDTPEEAKEKKRTTAARRERVPDLFGMVLEDEQPKDKPGPPVDSGKSLESLTKAQKGTVKVKTVYLRLLVLGLVTTTATTVALAIQSYV